jgi:hypothetical protein
MEPELFDVLITIRTTTKQKEKVDSLRGDKSRSEFIREILRWGMSSYDTIKGVHQAIVKEPEYLRGRNHIRVQELAQAMNISRKSASNLLRTIGWKVCGPDSRVNNRFARGDSK